MKENKEIKKATEKVEKMSEDEKLRRLAFLREKAIMDEKDIYRAGVDKGIENGKEKGIKEATIKIASKMKKEGFSTEIIMEITDLTEEEIKQI